MKVQCLICGETFKYQDDNTGVLIEHLNKKHSGTDVFRYLGKNALKSKQGRNLLQIFECPYCCKIGRPVLKKKGGGKPGPFTNLWCWPACCPTDSNCILNLYCSYCGKYGGYYDRRNGKFVTERPSIIEECNDCEVNNNEP